MGQANKVRICFIFSLEEAALEVILFDAKFNLWIDEVLGMDVTSKRNLQTLELLGSSAPIFPSASLRSDVIRYCPC